MDIPHGKSSKKSREKFKKGGRFRDLLVGIEKGYSSVCKVGKCSEVLFFFISSIEKVFPHANSRVS
jgi:hypothetical protein